MTTRMGQVPRAPPDPIRPFLRRYSPSVRIDEHEAEDKRPPTPKPHLHLSTMDQVTDNKSTFLFGGSWLVPPIDGSTEAMD